MSLASLKMFPRHVNTKTSRIPHSTMSGMETTPTTHTRLHWLISLNPNWDVFSSLNSVYTTLVGMCSHAGAVGLGSLLSPLAAAPFLVYDAQKAMKKRKLR